MREGKEGSTFVNIAQEKRNVSHDRFGSRHRLREHLWRLACSKVQFTSFTDDYTDMQHVRLHCMTGLGKGNRETNKTGRIMRERVF